MSEARIQSLLDFSAQLFEKRGMLMDLWQILAEEFYPERADFTAARALGDELTQGLTTSYPVIARRDLGNSFAAMLRPTAKDWFSLRTNRPDREDTVSKQWLEWVTKLMKAAMYDPAAQFSRATKEGDHDFATFGQTVISTELNRTGNGLLYRCWHLRDVAWAENYEGKVANIFRRWKPTARTLVQMFPKTVDEKVRKLLEKEPYTEIECLHCIMPAEEYAELSGAKVFRTPYVSIYIDTQNKTELECTGSWTRHYNIPRWSTVSGSQYAHSPAAIAALPDARLLQAMTLTLLTAGEKAVDPPMIGVQQAIRGDIALYPGGVTWVDSEYDERLGEVLRALSVDKTGINFGMEAQQDLRQQLADAWYLSKLNLPPVTGRDMTAYEVGQRVQEFIRNTLPLFEPMEADYNGGLCNDTFEILMHASSEIRTSVPHAIQGADTQFHFESPLHEAVDKAKVGQLAEAMQVLATAMQFDQSSGNVLDGRKAIRDTLEAVVPADWLRDEAAVDALLQQQAQAAQAQQMLQLMQGGANVAKTLNESGMQRGSPQ